MKLYCILSRGAGGRASLTAMLDCGKQLRQLDSIEFENCDDRLLRLMEWVRDLIGEVSYAYLEDRDDDEDDPDLDKVLQSVSGKLREFQSSVNQQLEDMIQNIEDGE